VDTEFHDHAWYFDDHAVERVEGEQVGKQLPAQIQGEVPLTPPHSSVEGSGG
jgi:hypothetical protein